MEYDSFETKIVVLNCYKEHVRINLFFEITERCGRKIYYEWPFLKGN